MENKKLLSQRNKFFYYCSVWEKRIRRYVNWLFDGKKYASSFSSEKLPYKIKEHQSILLRQLGKSDMQLQINKIKNLQIAIEKLNGIIIKPGETFSFCKLVGMPTKKKGYLMGMELSFGQATSGIGGGICQIANLINWMALHSPLNITERHHHSFDPFPDDGRIVPFGCGASLFYNYRDYQLHNPTSHTFQINFYISDKYLHGELLVNNELNYTYRIIEKEHAFVRFRNNFYRMNQIWREKISKVDSNGIEETELLMKNFALAMYTPENYSEVDHIDIA